MCVLPRVSTWYRGEIKLLKALYTSARVFIIYLSSESLNAGDTDAREVTVACNTHNVEIYKFIYMFIRNLTKINNQNYITKNKKIKFHIMRI